jgi:magnesium transporter
MATDPALESWERIEGIVQGRDAAELHDFLDTLAPAEIARAISRLNESDRGGLLTLLEPGEAADLIEELADAQGADLLEELPVDKAAAIVTHMESDDRADVLGEIEADSAEAILQQMAPAEAEDARKLLTYSPNTAGGIMITEYLAYDEHLRVEDVLTDMRANGERYSDYGVQYAYVIGRGEAIIGVLRMRDLLLSPVQTQITDLMITEPETLGVETPLEELEQFFDRHTYLGIPITAEGNKLVGVVRREDVEEAGQERADKTLLRFTGIADGEELRSMPVVGRAYGRLKWLSANIVLNIVAASVIAHFIDTLDKWIALAIFIPIVSDMSGCSGNQAVAVSIRELTLGVIKPRDFLRVLIKECMLGLLNGAALGFLLGAVAVIWQEDLLLGFVIGFALAANTLLSVMLGGVIPLLLRKLKVDPALVSGPMLTTVTDICGFALVFLFASMALDLKSG